MTTALLFPGQGGPPPWSAIEMSGHSDSTRRLLDRASAGTGRDLLRLLKRGGRDLECTEIVQPLVTAVSLGVFEELAARGLRCDVVAGHSLGEVAAWAATGAIDPQAALELAVTRGRLMGREAAENPGTMVSVRAESLARVDQALTVAREFGQAWLAAHNAPEEWVLTGDGAALGAVARELESSPMKVSGAWHSPKMAGAVAEFSLAAEGLECAPATTAFVCNGTGDVVHDMSHVPRLLGDQLVRPIEWVRVMETLVARGVDTFVTIGPGTILRALVRKCIGRDAVVHTTESWQEIEQVAEALS